MRPIDDPQVKQHLRLSDDLDTKTGNKLELMCESPGCQSLPWSQLKISIDCRRIGGSSWTGYKCSNLCDSNDFKGIYLLWSRPISTGSQRLAKPHCFGQDIMASSSSQHLCGAAETAITHRRLLHATSDMITICCRIMPLPQTGSILARLRNTQKTRSLTWGWSGWPLEKTRCVIWINIWNIWVARFSLAAFVYAISIQMRYANTNTHTHIPFTILYYVFFFLGLSRNKSVNTKIHNGNNTATRFGNHSHFCSMSFALLLGFFMFLFLRLPCIRLVGFFIYLFIFVFPLQFGLVSFWPWLISDFFRHFLLL